MDFVKYKMENHIGIITISRPEALNALNTQVLIELDETIDMIDLNETWVVIVTGAGSKAFVAGADIGEMVNLNEEEALTFGRTVLSYVHRR